jgi:hypothetical protein
MQPSTLIVFNAYNSLDNSNYNTHEDMNTELKTNEYEYYNEDYILSGWELG